MKLTLLGWILLVVGLVVISFVSGLTLVTRTTGGSVEPVVADSTWSVVFLGKLGGYRVFRVDDHDRQVTCYAIPLGGIDCDRSFYERR